MNTTNRTTPNNKRHQGRPAVSENSRLSKAVTVKFCKADYETLKAKSRKAGKRMAEYIRESALHSNVVLPHTEEDMQTYRSLVGMANNLNQLAKRSHQSENFYYTSVRLDVVLNEMYGIIRNYKRNHQGEKR